MDPLKTTSQDCQPLITRYPMEILFMVVRLLDGYSIDSFLHAFPNIQSYFIIITNRPQLTTSLFTVKGPRLVSLDAYYENPQYNRSYFKLFEIDDSSCGERHGYRSFCSIATKPGFELTPFYKSLNSYSFLHLATPYSGRIKVVRFLHAIQKTGITAEISNCPLGMHITPASYRLLPTLAASGLKSVIIKYVTRVKDLVLPEMENFTVVFGASEVRPVLRNIVMPKVKHLKIAYHYDYPVISGLFCSPPMHTVRTGGRKCFEIVHMGSMKTLIQNPFKSSCVALNEILSDSDFEFLICFNRVNVIGGPAHLAQMILGMASSYEDDSKVFYLHWKKTFEDPGCFGGYPRKDNRIELFSFESVCVCPPANATGGVFSSRELTIVYHTNCISKSFLDLSVNEEYHGYSLLSDGRSRFLRIAVSDSYHVAILFYGGVPALQSMTPFKRFIPTESLIKW